MVGIQDEFLPLSVISGFPPVLAPEDALALIRRCREQQVRVLGIDGFHMFDQSQQPDMGESIDYSRLGDTVEDCWNAAEQFLSERMRSGLYFEVVTADQ
ncbi:MAG: hypothetical protein NXI29_14590 [bacterium]|nr:hypothetical protein [bacterium]